MFYRRHLFISSIFYDDRVINKRYIIIYNIISYIVFLHVIFLILQVIISICYLSYIEFSRTATQRVKSIKNQSAEKTFKLEINQSILKRVLRVWNPTCSAIVFTQYQLCTFGRLRWFGRRQFLLWSSPLSAIKRRRRAHHLRSNRLVVCFNIAVEVIMVAVARVATV